MTEWSMLLIAPWVNVQPESTIIDVLVTRYKGELLVFCLTERALFSISYDLKTVNSVLQLDETAVSLFKISDSEVAVCFR